MSNNFIDLKSELKEKGYKVTSQRQAVLDVIVQNDGKHLSTEEIYDLVRIKHPEVGIATVYRTLSLLDSLKLVYKLDFDDGFNRYELNNKKEDHRHHHLICTKCGNVEEVQEDLLDALEDQIKEKNGFQVQDHKVKFYGFCKNCLEQNKK